MPWQKGQSGNPNGRRPNGKTLADALRKHLSKNSNRQELVAALWSLAVGHWVQETDKKGSQRVYLASPDWHAIALIFERLEGKAPIALQHSGPDGGPIPISLVDEVMASANPAS